MSGRMGSGSCWSQKYSQGWKWCWHCTALPYSALVSISTKPGRSKAIPHYSLTLRRCLLKLQPCILLRVLIPPWALKRGRLHRLVGCFSHQLGLSQFSFFANLCQLLFCCCSFLTSVVMLILCSTCWGQDTEDSSLLGFIRPGRFAVFGCLFAENILMVCTGY